MTSFTDSQPPSQEGTQPQAVNVGMNIDVEQLDAIMQDFFQQIDRNLDLANQHLNNA